jgi:hypothetical protein
MMYLTDPVNSFPTAGTPAEAEDRNEHPKGYRTGSPHP